MNDPKLKLIRNRIGDIRVDLVCRKDYHLSAIYNVTDGCKRANAKQNLRQAGYSTTFAHWNPDGSLSYLTRPLEIIPGRVAVPGADGLWFELDEPMSLIIASDRKSMTKHKFYLHSLYNGPVVNTESTLRQYGYSTDFAHWTELGQFAGLK